MSSRFDTAACDRQTDERSHIFRRRTSRLATVLDHWCWTL